MKVHINVGKPAINGYINLDPMGGEDKCVGQITNINGIAEDAECTEILADDILDFIPSNEILNTLRHYVGKLRHGGKLIIGGTDLHSVCQAIVTKQLNCVEANHLLHGEQNNTWAFKYGQINLDDLVKLLSDLGLKIMKKRLNSYKMCVEAIRP